MAFFRTLSRLIPRPLPAVQNRGYLTHSETTNRGVLLRYSNGPIGDVMPRDTFQKLQRYRRMLSDPAHAKKTTRAEELAVQINNELRHVYCRAFKNANYPEVQNFCHFRRLLIIDQAKLQLGLPERDVRKLIPTLDVEGLTTYGAAVALDAEGEESRAKDELVRQLKQAFKTAGNGCTVNIEGYGANLSQSVIRQINLNDEYGFTVERAIVEEFVPGVGLHLMNHLRVKTRARP